MSLNQISRHLLSFEDSSQDSSDHLKIAWNFMFCFYHYMYVTQIFFHFSRSCLNFFILLAILPFCVGWSTEMVSQNKKGKERKNIYIVPFILYTMYSFKALRHGPHSFTCKLHHACLSFVSVHQMAPHLTEVTDIQLQHTTHLLTPKGWKAALAWLVDL